MTDIKQKYFPCYLKSIAVGLQDSLYGNRFFCHEANVKKKQNFK